MLSSRSILINHLSYPFPNSLQGFQNCSLQFGKRRYGIVGDNGSGKTTLLKLIANQIEPSQGSIQVNGRLQYLQQEKNHTNVCLAEMLGIEKKWKALERIGRGLPQEDDVEIIGNDWNIVERAKNLLADFKLDSLSFNRLFSTLSSGQKTKCHLIRLFLSETDFLLMDEPTNHLDSFSRNKLYEWIQKTSYGLLIVSHDRQLLMEMDEIIEISSKGVKRYGGNYQQYQSEKTIFQQSLEHQYTDAKRAIKNIHHRIQETREKHEHRKARGRALRKTGSQCKLILNSMRSRSEKTQSSLSVTSHRMLTISQQKLEEAQANLEIKEKIHADLKATQVPIGKRVLRIENLSFGYPGQSLLFESFDLDLIGPRRIALSGDNGSGKTTLIQLILGKLQPISGQITLDRSLTCHLDQEVQFLHPHLSLLDNFQRLNPDISVRDSYFALADFNFRNQEAQKLIQHLSGGEKIRAGLAVSLLSKTPPQLIILDEPTNHLDIRSIEAIENALNEYKGALIVVSHDTQFLKQIHIDPMIVLPSGSMPKCKQIFGVSTNRLEPFGNSARQRGESNRSV